MIIHPGSCSFFFFFFHTHWTSSGLLSVFLRRGQSIAIYHRRACFSRRRAKRHDGLSAIESVVQVRGEESLSETISQSRHSGTSEDKGRISSRLSSDRCCLRQDHTLKSGGWDAPRCASVFVSQWRGSGAHTKLFLDFICSQKFLFPHPRPFYPCRFRRWEKNIYVKNKSAPQRAELRYRLSCGCETSHRGAAHPNTLRGRGALMQHKTSEALPCSSGQKIFVLKVRSKQDLKESKHFFFFFFLHKLGRKLQRQIVA